AGGDARDGQRGDPSAASRPHVPEPGAWRAARGRGRGARGRPGRRRRSSGARHRPARAHVALAATRARARAGNGRGRTGRGRGARATVAGGGGNRRHRRRNARNLDRGRKRIAATQKPARRSTVWLKNGLPHPPSGAYLRASMAVPLVQIQPSPPAAEPSRKPSWLKVKASGGPTYVAHHVLERDVGRTTRRLDHMMRDLKLHTVC